MSADLPDRAARLAPLPPKWTDPALAEVADEMGRQVAKWGEQNHALGTGPDERFCRARFSTLAQDAKAECQANGPGEDTWAAILLEEVFEALEEADPAKVRAELIQVAAVAVQAVLSIDRVEPHNQRAEEQR